MKLNLLVPVFVNVHLYLVQIKLSNFEGWTPVWVKFYKPIVFVGLPVLVSSPFLHNFKPFCICHFDSNTSSQVRDKWTRRSGNEPKLACYQSPGGESGLCRRNVVSFTMAQTKATYWLLLRSITLLGVLSTKMYCTKNVCLEE